MIALLFWWLLGWLGWAATWGWWLMKLTPVLWSAGRLVARLRGGG